jgi:hypothetical protein
MMTHGLLQVNELLIAAVLIVSFSLFAYIALHNWRNDTARAICMLLLNVTIVYGGDVLIGRAERPETIQFLLRLQWLGISLVPAAYIHLSMALLRASRGNGQRYQRRWSVMGCYSGSVLFFWLATSTDLVVQGGISRSILAQFQAGPLFWGYTAFFFGSLLITFQAITRARQNALTPTLRRRLTYLRNTFLGPGLGVFPYLVVAGGDLLFSQDISLIALSLVNLVVIVTVTVMTYSVGFQGVFMPDRLIKQDFIRWGLYGPVVGVTIILCFQMVPWLDTLLGLPGDTLITFAVMIMTVMMPIFISRTRPYLDALVYMQDQEEIDYLRNLPRSIFTGTDLRQLLENTLIAVCGALHTETGFVVGPGREGYTVKVLCGSRHRIKQFVAEHPLSDLMQQLDRETMPTPGVPPHTGALPCNCFWLLPLRSPDGLFLGALGVARAQDSKGACEEPVPPESRHLIDVIAHHMELALTTVHMQQRIFETLRSLDPGVQSLQHLTTRLDQATSASLDTLDTDVSLDPKFPRLVKDALAHYWGGPKLSDSPLLELRMVRRLIDEEGGSPTRALQAVLRQAINNLRPDDQLDPSAQEWILYNILELRFLQGKRIRDVTSRLAMSESDFYRKQRVAVEEVARQLVLMENGEKEKTEKSEGPLKEHQHMVEPPYHF